MAHRSAECSLSTASPTTWRATVSRVDAERDYREAESLPDHQLEHALDEERDDTSPTAATLMRARSAGLTFGPISTASAPALKIATARSRSGCFRGGMTFADGPRNGSAARTRRDLGCTHCMPILEKENK